MNVLSNGATILEMNVVNRVCLAYRPDHRHHQHYVVWLVSPGKRPMEWHTGAGWYYEHQNRAHEKYEEMVSLLGRRSRQQDAVAANAP